ncbi:hypothetical protein HanIR_Chr10g0459181 [Helianthus annuus]|nr:hypothetical protein HanIR_Chr10g0459181 [Helianthus annuus]
MIIFCISLSHSMRLSLFKSLLFIYLSSVYHLFMARITRLHILYQAETETGSLRAYHLVSEPRWLVSVSVWSVLHRKSAGDVKRL